METDRSDAVCPAASRIEAGSHYVNGVPDTPALMAIARQTLGMMATARPLKDDVYKVR